MVGGYVSPFHADLPTAELGQNSTHSLETF